MADGKIKASDLVSAKALKVHGELAHNAEEAIGRITTVLKDLTKAYEASAKAISGNTVKEAEALKVRQELADITLKSKTEQEQLKLETVKLREAQKQQTLAETELAKRKVAQLRVDKQRIINDQQLARSAKKVSGAYKELSQRLTDSRNHAKNTAVTHGLLSKAFKEEQREVLKLDKYLKKVDSSLGQSQRKVGQYTNALRGLGTTFRTLASAFGFAGFLFALAGVLKNTFNRIKDFDRAIFDLAATMNVARSAIKDLETDAIKLGGVTKFTSTQIVDLQKQLAKKGFNNQEILDSTEAIINLSVATGEDLSKSAEVASATLRALGLDSSEMTRVVDVMASSFTKTALDLDSFTESAKFVTPIARKAGISIEELTALLGTLADNGIKGSIAGTGLRKIISELDKSGKPLAERLKELSKRSLSLADATDEVGRRAQTSLLVLTSEIAVTERLTKAFGDVAGVAQEMADTQMKSLENQLILLDSAWNTFILNLEKGDGIISEFLRQGITNAIVFLKILGKFNETDIDTAQREYNEALQEGVDIQTKLLRDRKKLNEEAKKGKGIVVDEKALAEEDLKNIQDQIKEKERSTKFIGEQKQALSKVNKELIIAENVASNLSKNSDDASKKRVKELEDQSIINFGAKRLLEHSIAQGKADSISLGYLKGKEKVLNRILGKNVDLNVTPQGHTIDTTSAQKNAADKQARLEIDVLIIKRKREADADKLILDDKNASYDDQLAALDRFYVNQTKITELNLVKDLIGWKKTEEEKTVIKEKATNELINIDTSRIKKEQALEISNVANVTKSLKKLTAAKEEEINNQISKLIDSYNIQDALDEKAGISYTIRAEKRKRLEEEILKLRTQGKIDTTAAEITFLEDIIKKLDPTTKGVKELIQLLAKLKATLSNIPKLSEEEGGFENWAKKANDAVNKVRDQFEQYAQALENSVGLLLQNKVDAIDQEIQANQDKYDKLKILAGDDEEFKSDLEKERAIKEAKLQEDKKKALIKQATFEKAIAVSRAIINVAQGVSHAFWDPGGVPGFILAGTIAALGAVEVAAIIAQPIKQFEKGGVMDGSGVALVGEKRHEVVQEPDGSTWITGNKPQLSYIKKGSVIYPSLDKFSQSQNYDNILRSSILTSINLDAKKMNNAETKKDFELNYQAIEKAMVSAVKKTKINNYVKMPSVKVDIDDQLWSFKKSQFK